MRFLFFENFIISISAIFENKVRSFLTALGIIIGVYSVTMMGTLIAGLDKTFEGSMSFLGKDVLYISRWEWFGDMEWWEVRNRPRIRPEYVEKVKDKSQYALAVAPVMQRGASLSYNENETRTQIFGTNVDYMETISTNIAEGRFFTNSEDRLGKRVTIIGDGIKKAFFGDVNPIGKYIKIDNMKFKVIGVLEEQAKFLGLFSTDKQAVLPFGAYKRIFSKRGFMRLSIKVPQDKLDESVDEIRFIMRNMRGLKPNQKDDFAINQTKAFEKQYLALKIAIGGTGTFITLLSLIVGGIGVMNIMFVSVKERVPIIGLQKSLGAKNYFILLQFLFESSILSLIGGLIGLFFVFLITLIDTGSLELTISFTNIILGISISSIIGLLAGMLPAIFASRLDPVEAIRSN